MGGGRPDRGSEWRAAYRRIRKPMPPPERVEEDRRREIEERDARRQVDDALADRATPPPPHAVPHPPSTPIVFRDRAEAGSALVPALARLAGPDTVVLGVPRGGVEVAAVVARGLGAPLDVVVPRKVGAPGNPELGLGAVAEGVALLDEQMVAALGVTEEFLRREIAAQQTEIARRTAIYRRGRPPLRLSGATAIVVDDGIATGGTAAAALRWARARGAAQVVLAVPVAPRESLVRLAAEADEIVVLSAPDDFVAVGQWYEDFDQVSDERVVELLAGSSDSRGPA